MTLLQHGRPTASRQLYVHDDPAAVATWCRARASDGCVYVAPSAAARRALQRSLAERGGVTVGLAITTPSRLLGVLESRAGLATPRLLPPILERLLVESAARAARVPLFEDDDAPAGAIAAVVRLFRALRLNGIPVGDYRDAGGDPRAANAFERFERRRAELGFADERERVEGIIRHGVPSIALVLEDPTVPHATARELLRALAERATSFHVGLTARMEELPWGAATGAVASPRPVAELPSRAVTDPSPPVLIPDLEWGAANTLSALGLEIVADQSAPRRTAAAMSAIGGAGTYDEVELVARRILALLRGDRALRPADVLAVAPTRHYLSLLNDALARLGVPVATPRSVPVLDVPLVRALLPAFRMLADERDDTPQAGLELLATPYVGLSLGRHDRVACRLVRAGRGALRSWRDEAQNDPRGPFRRFAESVDGLARSLQEEHTARELGTILSSLALEHSFLASGRRANLAAGRDDAVRLDQQGWNAVADAIAELGDALPLAGVARLSAVEWLGALTDSLADVRVRVEARARDGVHLARAGAGLPIVRHVFALGWREGLVPRRVRDEPLLPDRVKRALNERGALFPLAAQRVELERERRDRVVRAARESLVVSWPATGDEGEAMLPSFYLDDLGITDRTVRGVGDVTWPISLAATRGERVARATILARHRPAASLGDEREAVRDVLQAVTADERRLYDGARHAGRAVALSAPARARLAPLASRMSASQAQMLAHCAYEHFGARRLAIRSLGAPALDARETGTIAHRVLARLGRAGFAAAPLDAIFDDAWTHAVRETPLGFDPAEPFEREMLRAQLAAMVEAERALLATSQGVPSHFELAFGMGDDDRGEERDAASRDEGIVLALPAGSPIPSTTLRGSIDRVDVVERERRRYGLAVDYKSGKGKSYFEAEQELADFQLSIYCEALPAFGIEPVGALYLGVAGAERHGVIRSDFADAFGVSEVRTVVKLAPEDFAGFVAARREALLGQVVRLAAGEIEIRPRKDDCKYCDLRPVCRIGTFGVGERGGDE